MINPTIIQGLRQIADQLDGSSTAIWLRRVADELQYPLYKYDPVTSTARIVNEGPLDGSSTATWLRRVAFELDSQSLNEAMAIKGEALRAMPALSSDEKVCLRTAAEIEAQRLASKYLKELLHKSNTDK